MSAHPSIQPILVTRKDQLRKLVEVLKQQSHVASDTESNSLHAYQERVCLIQFSIPGQDYLVDPLANPDLEPLAPIFADPEIEMIFHAAEYDAGCLRRDFGFQIANLFDTRIASRMLGRTQTGLGHLLLEEFGVRLNKRFQRANWGKRPLSPELLSYASLDSHYLLPLRHRLANALHEAGRWLEAQEACTYIARTSTHNKAFDPQGYWRIPNARRLKPVQRSVLRELFLFREEKARNLDRPPFMVVDDKTLIIIARARPKNLEALRTVEGMTPGRTKRFGKQLLASVARGERSPPPKPPKRIRADVLALARFDRLRQWRKRVAIARKIESDLVIPRDVLWEIASQAPQDMQALKPIMGLLQWRFETYGPEILEYT
ncbi:MAG: HRDC domain-containing protein [Anaerolineales bacterium]|jgi:ribonuclease D